MQGRTYTESTKLVWYWSDSPFGGVVGSDWMVYQFNLSAFWQIIGLKRRSRAIWAFRIRL